MRIVLLGVKEEYRRIGIEAVFYANFIRAAQTNGLSGERHPGFWKVTK